MDDYLTRLVNEANNVEKQDCLDSNDEQYVADVYHAASEIEQLRKQLEAAEGMLDLALDDGTFSAPVYATLSNYRKEHGK